MTSGQLAVAPTRRHLYWHTALTLAVLVAVGCLARRHWPVLETGALRLAVADHELPGMQYPHDGQGPP